MLALGFSVYILIGIGKGIFRSRATHTI
jgi:hypothetical protein